MVHKGFWHSWSTHGVRSRVCDTIADIMAAQGRLACSVEVLLTGRHPPLTLALGWTKAPSASPLHALDIIRACRTALSFKQLLQLDIANCN